MTTLETPRIHERESLIRMARAVELGGDESEGDLLVGYAAVFNEFTEIDSWEGHFEERIAPGAFRKTLRDRGDQVQVLFNHGMDPQIGDKPLGRIREIREDEKGLYVEVPLDDTSYNRDIKALLRSGALRGMSFRMTVVDDKWEDLDSAVPKRTIRQVKLLELGPVTFPAYAATQAGVRAHAPQAFEAFRSATETATTAAVADALDELRDQQIDPEEETPESLEPPSEITKEPADATPDSSGPEDSTRSTVTDDESADTPPPTLSPATIQRQAELSRDRLTLVLRSAQEYLTP